MITKIVGLDNSSNESLATIEERTRQVARANQNIQSMKLSIISQDCLGGVIYHDTQSQFLSPTINLYLNASDFIKLALNLDYYLCKDLIIPSNTQPIIGLLEDIKVHFVHYDNQQDAKNKWDKRKARIIRNKILIMCTDRFGFGEAEFEQFKLISYPKILVTRNPNWQHHDFVVCLDKYSHLKHIGQTIPLREFYHDKIFHIINQIVAS